MTKYLDFADGVRLPLQLVMQPIGLLGNRESGKALALDTMLPTPTGWVAMGDVRVGDTLFDERGMQCRVTYVAPVQKDRLCFRVIFSDGESIVADGEHLWFTESRASRQADNQARQKGSENPGRFRKHFPGLVTTVQMRETLKEYGETNHAIPTCGPVQCSEAELLIPPYLLGVWLGDGTGVTGVISSGDREVLDRVRLDGDTYHVLPSQEQPGCSAYRVDGLTAKLRVMGVLENKHVPAAYLRASEAQRRDLLAGLMDTDGTIDADSNRCLFYNTNERIADAAAELALSLGWKVTKRLKTAMLNGREYAPCHEIGFRPSQQVFKLARKAERFDPDVAQVMRTRRRFVEAVEPVSSVPVRCVEVDSPSHLYLAGRAFIPTHNTYGGLKLFEQTHKAGVQSVAVDCVGKWWGLRLGADGKAAGGLSNVYIFGGKRADFPLLADKGALVAEVLIEKRCSAVLDVSLLRKGDRKRFLTDFAEEFHHLAKQEDVAHPCVLFLEEAHTVIPQKPQKGDERMLGAFEDIVLLGRNAGMGVVIMDQRPAHVNKSCLAMVEVLIALRTTWHADRKVYAEWIGAKGETGLSHFEDDLASLQRGHGFIWAPTEKIFSKLAINKRETFDASATAKVGGVSGKVGALSPVDVKQLGEAMTAVVEEAARNDPRKAQARVRELESEVAQLKAKPAQVAQPVSIAAELKALEHCVGEALKLNAALTKNMEAFVATLDKASSATARSPVVPKAPAPMAPPNKSSSVNKSSSANIVGKQQDMLNVLSKLGTLRRDELALFVCMSPGGGFNNYVGNLASQGFLTTGSGSVCITAEGYVLANPKNVRTFDECIAEWETKLVGKQRDMLRHLVECGKGVSVRREQLAQKVEMALGGGFNNYVGHMASANLVVTGGGTVTINPSLYKLA